jgi:hypothetical protein
MPVLKNVKRSIPGNSQSRFPGRDINTDDAEMVRQHGEISRPLVRGGGVGSSRWAETAVGMQLVLRCDGVRRPAGPTALNAVEQKKHVRKQLSQPRVVWIKVLSHTRAGAAARAAAQ